LKAIAAALAFTMVAGLSACSAGDPAPPARVVTQLEVSIDAANNCSLENKPVSCQQVAAVIKTRYPTSKPHIFICVDKQTSAGAALEVLNAVNAAGFPAADFQCGKAAAS
jgi:biopolymer transport protein ExbD